MVVLLLCQIEIKKKKFILHMEWCAILKFDLNYLLEFDSTNEECVCVCVCVRVRMQHDLAILISKCL